MIDLYDAILARRSVRVYDRMPLTAAVLDQVARAVGDLEALDPGLRFNCTVQAVAEGDDIVAAMGGYGRLLSIPHILVPAIADGSNSLIDFGYRVEQVVIRLTQMGIGTCWIGALTHRASVVARFGPPEGMTVAAIIAFGRAAHKGAGRAVDSVIRSAVGATRKKPVSEYTWRDRVGNPATLTDAESKALEALRASPSTGNAQPWCVVLSDGLLYLAVRADARYYQLSGNIGYHLVDAGIGMANVRLALRTSGREAAWRLLRDEPGLRGRLGLAANYVPAGAVPLAG
jgi:nitroreductase